MQSMITEKIYSEDTFGDSRAEYEKTCPKARMDAIIDSGPLMDIRSFIGCDPFLNVAAYITRTKNEVASPALVNIGYMYAPTKPPGFIPCNCKMIVARERIEKIT